MDIVESDGEGQQIVTQSGSNSITKQQWVYIQGIVAGNNMTDAAKLAKYKFPAQQGWTLSKQPYIQTAIRNELMRKLTIQGGAVGVNTLIEIATNTKAPSGARVQAANSLLDRAGLGMKILDKQKDGEKKPASQMTMLELEAFITAGKAALEAAKDKAAIPGEYAQDGAQQGHDDLVNQGAALPSEGSVLADDDAIDVEPGATP